MPRRTGSALAALLALAIPALAAAEDVSISAAVDRTELPADEVLTLELTLEAPEAPTAIDLREGELPFEIVSRSQSRQASFTLGGGGVQAHHVFRYRLALAPRRAGALTIPPITATVAGKRYATEPIAVKVLPAGARAGPAPQGGPAPQPGGSFRGWERDLALAVEVDRRDAFVGEQVTVSVWLLSPLGVVGYEGYKPPLYDGAWAEDLETPQTLAFQVRTVEGIPTRAYLLQRLALFPTRAGTLTIGPYQADVAVRVGGDRFLDPFPEVRRVHRASRPIEIAVKPLPPGAPAGFEAVNVGTLRLAAELSEARVAAGQPVTVRVTASGEGNVRALALPRLGAVEGAKRFQPTASEKVAVKAARFGGARVEETVLVPERTGELVIPALAWPVFDPRTGRYATLRTSELRVAVAPGATAPDASTAGANPLATALRPIRADRGLARRGPPPWRTPLFGLLVAAPVLAFLGLAAADRLRGHARATSGARRVRAAGRTARSRLVRARRLADEGEREPFLAEVERALLGYASDKLGRPATGLTRDALSRALGEAGAHPPAIRALAAALDASDAARYGRGSAAREEVLAAAERALTLLEEADWAPAAQVRP